MSARILIADDDEVSCQFFAKVLKGEGYQVDWVRTGEEARLSFESRVRDRST